MNDQPSSPETGSRRFALAALASALLLHGAWWWLAEQTVMPRRMSGPVLRSELVAQPAGLEDWLRVWSSSLFALPAAPAASDANASEPRVPPMSVYPSSEVDLRLVGPAWMAPRTAPTLAMDEQLPGPNLDLRGLRQQRALPLDAELSSVVIQYVIDVIWSDRFGERVLEQIDAVDQSPWQDERPWEAQFSVTLGPQGWVRHYFMDHPTESRERNLTLMRIIMALHVAGGEDGDVGHIVVRYRPVWSGPNGADTPPEGTS